MSERWGTCPGCRGTGDYNNTGDCLTCGGSGHSGDIKEWFKKEAELERDTDFPTGYPEENSSIPIIR